MMFYSILKTSTSFSNTTICNASRFIRSIRKRVMPVPVTEKRLDCVILGEPNVGKSVLLNTLVKTKLAATSRKRHTTRSEILGVFNNRNTQLVFYDTPGFVRKSEANKTDVKTLRELAESSVKHADVTLLVVDAARQNGSNHQLSAFEEMVKLALEFSKKEVILILNKVDLVEPKSNLLILTRELVSIINGIKLGPEKAHLSELDTTTFMISALKNDGIVDIKNYLISIAPIKPWTITKEEGPTNLSDEERVQEMILEMLMENTHEEIPYISEIICKSIETINEKRMKINVDILVNSSSQQRIIIGQQGRTLVKIRQAAVQELEKIFNKEILLFLWINVRKQNDNN